MIPFDRYMEMALYEPELGYYNNDLRKFGSQGDFITAPETSALFGRCIAHAILPVLNEIEQPDILEFGPGSGVLAVDILCQLEKQGKLPTRYLILERSTALRQRQHERFARDIPHLLERITWLDSLPAKKICGVIIANEVMDALSVKRFIWKNQQAVELGVGLTDNGEFTFQTMPETDTTMQDALQKITSQTQWCENYQSEWSPLLKPWIQSIADCLDQGTALLIDYGSVQSEHYHAQRQSGSLMCHYRHHAHADPFILPGLQDITAYVDFTAVANAADSAGLQVSGFTTQTHFLLTNDLETFMAEIDSSDQQAFFKRVTECKTLTMPGEMGERFKTISLTKNCQQAPQGFASQDLRGRL